MISNFIKREKVNKLMTIEEVYSELNEDSLNLSKSEILSNSEIIYACINLIANSIARMPFNLYERTEKGKEKINNELSLILKRRPNSFMTPSDFKRNMIVQMLIYGEAFCWIKTKNGKVVELLPLDSSVTTLEKINGSYWVVTRYNDKQETLKYETVLHFRDIIKDCYGKKSISRVDVAMEKLNIIYRADKMIETLYKNGGSGVVKGAITTEGTISNESKLILKRAFTDILNLEGNGIAVLDGKMDFKNFGTNSMTLQDQQFIDSQKYNRQAICSVFGVNPALIGSTESTNYSNLIQIQRQFIESLTPLIVNTEEEMGYKLISSFEQDRYFIKVNMNVALREDPLVQAQVNDIKIKNGTKTRQECRDDDDLNHIEGIEELLMSLNYVPLSKWEYYIDNKGDNKETKDDE